ncbi:MAG TPA: carboxylesterase family protein, partial [Blastocatellia bacterium]|nr:carboxylesterase family protein [Blastocatellia bacterium]
VDKQTDPIAALKALSAEDLFKKSVATLGGGFGPDIDGWIVPDEPDAVFAAGKEHAVPLIIGSNHNEGTILLRAIPMRTGKDYENYVRRSFGKDADTVLKLYPPPTEAKDTMSVADRVFSDRIAATSQMLAEANTKINSKSYLYHFTKTSNAPRFAGLGAYHAAEIPYVFASNQDSDHFDEKDRDLAKTISSYWVRFAATGDPNGAGSPEWPKCGTTAGRYIELGSEVTVGSQVVNKQAYEILTASGSAGRVDRQ